MKYTTLPVYLERGKLNGFGSALLIYFFMERIIVLERTKAHILRNRGKYEVAGIITIAGITYVIMKGNIAQWGMRVGHCPMGIRQHGLFIFRQDQTVNITSVFDRRGRRGHPGWPVRSIENDTVFPSARKVSEIFDIPEGIVSGHLNGKFPDANGMHFEWVDLVPSAA